MHDGSPPLLRPGAAGRRARRRARRGARKRVPAPLPRRQHCTRWTRTTSDASDEPNRGTDSLLRTFVDGDRLLGLPSRIGRRRAVLTHLAQHAFRPGERYPEQAVNDILRQWSEGSGTDHVAIRRYLVELDIVDRADGLYWLRAEAGTGS
ncbi:DUF2087 domain-containing protein [Streptomyces sp. NPDC001108]